MGIMVILQCQSNLFEVVRTLHATSRLSSGLYRRQEQSDQDANDCDHNQEFDQSKCVASVRHRYQLPFKRAIWKSSGSMLDSKNIRMGLR